MTRKIGIKKLNITPGLVFLVTILNFASWWSPWTDVLWVYFLVATLTQATVMAASLWLIRGLEGWVKIAPVLLVIMSLVMIAYGLMALAFIQSF